MVAIFWHETCCLNILRIRRKTTSSHGLYLGPCVLPVLKSAFWKSQDRAKPGRLDCLARQVAVTSLISHTTVVVLQSDTIIEHCYCLLVDRPLLTTSSLSLSRVLTSDDEPRVSMLSLVLRASAPVSPTGKKKEKSLILIPFQLCRLCHPLILPLLVEYLKDFDAISLHYLIVILSCSRISIIPALLDLLSQFSYKNVRYFICSKLQFSLVLLVLSQFSL